MAWKRIGLGKAEGCRALLSVQAAQHYVPYRTLSSVCASLISKAKITPAHEHT